MYAGFLTRGGAANATWVGFDPLSNTVHSPGTGMDLWIYGVLLATAGELIWGACLLATIVRHRAPGMTLLRMPVFTWSITVTTPMVLFAFPVLIVAMALLWVEPRWGGVFVGGDGAVA